MSTVGPFVISKPGKNVIKEKQRMHETWDMVANTFGLSLKSLLCLSDNKWQINPSAWHLTFKNRASYIYRTGVPLPSRCCILYIYFFSANISSEYFKHAAHSAFFSKKCHLFHNATFLVPVLFTFYIQGVLKFKCKIRVPKGLRRWSYVSPCFVQLPINTPCNWGKPPFAGPCYRRGLT